MDMLRVAATRMDATFWHRRGYVIRHEMESSNADGGYRFLDLKHAVVRVRVVGRGPETIVMVPDPPNVIEHHTPVIERLRSDFRIICFELPGFGFSFPKPRFMFTLDEVTDTMEELLDSLKVRQATISMACLGGFSAIQLAARRPDLVGRLVLSQIPSFPELRSWTRRKDVLHLIKTPFVGQLLLTCARGLVARHWYRAALPQEGLVTNYATPTLHAFQRGACFCLASAFQSVQRGRQPKFEPVSQKTTVIWGSSDSSHEGTNPKSIFEHLPHATWIESPDSGHFPYLEDPELYVSVLTGGVSASGAGLAQKDLAPRTASIDRARQSEKSPHQGES